MKFQVSAIALGCAALMSGCGGGSSSSSGGIEQSMTFSLPFSGTAVIGVPPATATATLQAEATSGGPVTYTSNTPDTCSVSGDKLSLLKAGECSVTATQAGYNGYAPVSRRQVLVSGRAFIRERISQTPHLTLHKLKDELAARGVNVSHNAVWLFLRREGLRFKKNTVRP